MYNNTHCDILFPIKFLSICIKINTKNYLKIDTVLFLFGIIA